MATKTPIFPMPLPQHYSDYGFDPQIDYFQVLEEARRHGKRSDGSMHFKLQKPISKEERSKSKKQRRQWWKNAFGLFWKSGRRVGGGVNGRSVGRVPSGPLYATESRAGRAGRANSGPLSAVEFMEVDVPYFSLRDLNLLESNGIASGEAMMKPIYLVT